LSGKGRCRKLFPNLRWNRGKDVGGVGGDSGKQLMLEALEEIQVNSLCWRRWRRFR